MNRVNAEVIFPKSAEVKFPTFAGDQAIGWIFGRHGAAD